VGFILPSEIDEQAQAVLLLADNTPLTDELVIDVEHFVAANGLGHALRRHGA